MVAEVEELAANPEGRARGVVLEANLDVGRGPVATVIVQKGTLRVGDAVVAGAAWGRVRALIDDKGDHVKEAPPSTPVQVLGFAEVPGRRRRVPGDRPRTRRPATSPSARAALPVRRPAQVLGRDRRPGPSSRTSSSRSSGARRPRSTSSSRPTSRARSKR